MNSDVVVSAIVAALSAGTAKGVTDAAKKAVVDAYSGLKELIKVRLGSHSEVAKALDNLEVRPDSEGRQQTLGEELQSANAGTDSELVSAAQALLELVHRLPQGETHIQFAQGQGVAQADRGSIATVNFHTSSGEHD